MTAEQKPMDAVHTLWAHPTADVLPSLTPGVARQKGRIVSGTRLPVRVQFLPRKKRLLVQIHGLIAIVEGGGIQMFHPKVAHTSVPVTSSPLCLAETTRRLAAQ